MGAGLAQLVLNGQLDSHITENPNINYFKYVYNRHVNFSMHNRIEKAETNGIIYLNKPTTNTTISFKIGHHGDLINKLYLCFNLPDIYSSDVYRFRWIKNIGHILIIEAKIKTDGDIVIDRLYGEWMNIWNELTNKDGDEYNRLIGNIPEFVSPNNNSTTYKIKNNKLYNNTYPIVETNVNNTNPSIRGDPSIRGRQLQVPLNFWFTRNPSLALPIYKMFGRVIHVDIEIRDIEKLYQVWCNKLKLYVSPAFYNQIYNLRGTNKINIETFINNDSSIKSELYVNYILLDSKYRAVALNGIREYVVDYVSYTKRDIKITDAGTDIELTNLSNHLHVKELIWVLRRQDIIEKFNIYDNYTASHVYNENMGILDSAKISWASTIIREDENAYYYNNIQPYQYHTNVPRTGIYCYSFSLFPEKIIASGSYNSEKIKTSLYLKLNNNDDNSEMQKNVLKRKEYTYLFELLKISSLYETYNIKETDVNFEVLIYSKVMNVFVINGGEANFKFT